MDKIAWNKFIMDNSSPSSFLQSWEWGELQKALGNKVYRFSSPLLAPFGGRGIKGEGENYELAAQIIVKKLPLGRSYLEIPKGPVLPPRPSSPPTWGGGVKGEGVWKEFIRRLKEIGNKEKSVLARINPPYPPPQAWGGDGGEVETILRQLSFRRPEILLHQREPEQTILVDLTKSEDELLQNMHEKSRYNIRLAQKKGVKVRVATQDEAAFEIFLDLLEETAKRDDIVSWPKERFWKLREVFMIPRTPPSPSLIKEGVQGEFPHAELLIGELDNQILAAAIIMLFGDAGTYLYAASSGEERSSNAPSLVLWEAILEAKRQGKQWYDMWGVAPAGASDNHPWAGITRFKSRYVKLGVTGREFFGLGAHDLVLDKRFYSLFKFAKKFRS